MDFYNFQNLPVERLSHEFKIAYKATEIEIQSGKSLRIPPVPIMIEQQQGTPASKETVERAMRNINALFGGNK